MEMIKPMRFLNAFRSHVFVATLALSCLTACVSAAETITNSIGMELVRIKKGSFDMGSTDGQFDETPVHQVTFTGPFFMGATEVTNAQYERFDPDHRDMRGKHEVSKEDDEAVVFVTWKQANAFCQWLSRKEGKPYRLPTEAEWEYACRAGSKTAYHAGEALPKEFHKIQKLSWHPEPVSLKVGQTPANAFGLHDMHGNVEEYCLDWYGPYPAGNVTNPGGMKQGRYRVTRGGSHNTELPFLRSANRSGMIPTDSNPLVGFRVVQGELPELNFAPPAETPLWAKDVSQERATWTPKISGTKPYFEQPITFVKIPEGANGPLYRKHNHCPDITPCPNGDLLATWYSTNTEPGRELTVVAARLRQGADQWEPAKVFDKVPDRNMHATSIWWDGDKTLYHFNGVSTAQGWRDLALYMRTSTDNGATWSEPHWIHREHQLRNMPIAGVIQAEDGTIIVPCDAHTSGNGGSAIHISSDGGQTWIDPGAKTEPLRPKYGPEVTGGSIAGIHAGVVQLKDGRLMALGRGDTIDDKMPMSISDDMGKTWTYSASPFPPIGGGQRLILMRLVEGPLLFVSFTGERDSLEPMAFPTQNGGTFEGRGMFAALSFDEGKTWPVRKLVTPGGKRKVYAGYWNKSVPLNAVLAEPRGYLAATQSPDGVIHLISSGQHYRFNLAWLKQPWNEGDG